MHSLVKVLVGDDGKEISSPVWHLLWEVDGHPGAFCTGEMVMYGSADDCVKAEFKKVKRGGITCCDCRRKLRAIKAVNI